jgi:hypothetical protein
VADKYKPMQAADVAQWDAEVGVLVVGFGGAGVAACFIEGTASSKPMECSGLVTKGVR